MSRSNQPRRDPFRLGDDTIEEMAAEWLAWRETGLSAEQAAEFARWRAVDPRHDEAIRRMEATQTLLARLPEAPNAAAMYAEIDALCATHRRRTWRKTVVRTTLVLAAAAGVAIAVWLPQRDSLSTPAIAYTTAADARRSIDLPDGSTLALSEDSEVRVDYRRAERRLDLAHGEAHFAVAKDAARPFVVSVGSITVRAIGTAFTIRKNEADVDVRVTEGKVLVTRAGESQAMQDGEASIHLVAGERARIPTGADATLEHGLQSFVVSNEAPDDDTHLVFANTPLAEAVERFNRHSRLQMEIGDPELRAKTIGGNFNANNAEAFIKLLAASGEITVEHVSETRVILHQARASVP